MQPVTPLSPAPSPQPAPAPEDPATSADGGFAALLTEPVPEEMAVAPVPEDTPPSPEAETPVADQAAPGVATQPIPFWAAVEPSSLGPAGDLADPAEPPAAAIVMSETSPAISPGTDLPPPEGASQPPTPAAAPIGPQTAGLTPVEGPAGLPPAPAIAPPAAPADTPAEAARPERPEGPPSYWSLRSANETPPPAPEGKDPAPQPAPAAAPQPADPPLPAPLRIDPVLAETDGPTPTGHAAALPSAPHSPQPGTAPVATGAALPPNVPRDLAVVITSGPTGPVELRLSPEELGHVRLSLSGEADRVIVTIQAERAETLDLLRRHADSLMTELRSFGFTGGTLSFSGWQRPPPQTAGPAAEGSVFVIESPPPPPSAGPAGASLLLRL